MSPRDRDQRESKNPPPGSAAAAELERGAAPIRDLEDLTTDPNASSYDTLQNRAKKAAIHSEAAANSTEALRSEFKVDILDQNRRIDSIRDKVGAVDAKVENVSGQMSMLIGMVKPLVDSTVQLQQLKVTKTVEVETARAMLPVEHERLEIERKRTEITDTSAKKATARQVVVMVFTALTSVTLLTLLITRASC